MDLANKNPIATALQLFQEYIVFVGNNSTRAKVHKEHFPQSIWYLFEKYFLVWLLRSYKYVTHNLSCCLGAVFVPLFLNFFCFELPVLLIYEHLN